MEKFKIVADSSADLHILEGIAFACAPLKIITDEEEYVDNKSLDVRRMVTRLLNYKGRSSTSCPNPQDWLKAFGDAENIFCITITATLSGSFNAATVAKELYEELYPERKVYVINSLSTGPEMKLMAEKIIELISAGEKFDSICQKVEQYKETTGLLFMLESMKNLANNGRVNPVVAKAAGLLGIRVVGKASEQGDLQPLEKCRGQEKALKTIVQIMKSDGVLNGKVRITHCFNELAAARLSELLHEVCGEIDVEIYYCGGLCSFYAEQGGMIIGYEKF